MVRNWRLVDRVYQGTLNMTINASFKGLLCWSIGTTFRTDVGDGPDG